MFLITDGPNQGSVVQTEDQACDLVSANIPAFGYIYIGEGSAPETGEPAPWGQKPTIDGSTTSCLHANINRAGR